MTTTVILPKGLASQNTVFLHLKRYLRGFFIALVLFGEKVKTLAQQWTAYE